MQSLKLLAESHMGLQEIHSDAAICEGDYIDWSRDGILTLTKIDWGSPLIGSTRRYACCLNTEWELKNKNRVFRILKYI